MIKVKAIKRHKEYDIEKDDIFFVDKDKYSRNHLGVYIGDGIETFIIVIANVQDEFLSEYFTEEK